MILQVSTCENVSEAGAKLFRVCYEFLRKNYPDVPAEWLTPISGKLGAHVAVWRFPSLAAKEAYDAKLAADSRWQKLFKEAGPGPFWTSQRDDFYKVEE